MDIETFVKNTLVEIMEGCRQAQESLKNSHARICPAFRADKDFTVNPNKPQLLGIMSNGRTILGIDFDPAVTAKEEAKGGITVVAAILGIGAQVKASEGSEQISRLKFTIPVSYPEIHVIFNWKSLLVK